MAMLEGFRIQNYRVLRDVTFGKLWNTQDIRPLTPLTAVIGKNGVGKSTVFDALGFLADVLKVGIEEACDSHGRGGFHRLRTQGHSEPIQFELYYRQNAKARPITYELSVDEKRGRPFVAKERLRQRRKGQSRGRPFSFLHLEHGRGMAWTGEEAVFLFDDEIENLLGLELEESSDRETIELQDTDHLGIATLGALKQHPRISRFREFIENWYLSYFTPDAARDLPRAGPQKHLNMHGDNLGNVVQFMEREHPRRFRAILSSIADKIPGVHHIDTERTADGRLLLRFNDRGFTDPFYAQQMSDGTLKVFAYLLLLEDPSPPPFLCIEEPENGLYHKLLDTLASEFRSHATGRSGGSQIFVTTHQPYFVDALEPDEVWLLEKGEDGFARVRRASASTVTTNLVGEGLPLGGLWSSDYLDGDK